MPGTATKDAPQVPDLEHKQAPAETGVGLLGTDDETGIVEALVSVTGIRDKVLDRIIPGAYAKTIAARRPKGIFGHDWGKWVARTEEVKELMPGDPALPKSTPQGTPWPAEAGAVYVKARFNLATPEGNSAYQNVKFFSETGECEWSVGYQVPKGKSTKTAAGRDIREMDWYEYSPVLFGAAPLTGSLAVKAAGAAVDDGEIDEDDDPVTAEADENDPDIAALHEAAMTAMDEDPAGWDAIDAASAIDPREEDLNDVDDEHEDDDEDQGGGGGSKMILAGEDGQHVTLEIKAGKGSARVSDRPWSDFKAADYTPAQYHRACLIHDHDPGTPDTKEHCKVPVREPNGTLNRNGVHAAAAALGGARGGVDASDDAKAKAKSALRGHYRTIGEDPPESMAESKTAGQEVTPGDVKAADRLKHWYEHGAGAALIGWGKPGDYANCVAIAGQHMDPEKARGYCQLRHKGATGFYAGHAPSEQMAHAAEGKGLDFEIRWAYDPAAEPGGRQLSGGGLAGEVKAAAAGGLLELPGGRSLEEHADLVADEVTGELTGAEHLPGGMPRHLVVVHGTWPDHVIASRIDTLGDPAAGQAFQIAYDVRDGDVVLGEPQPVTLAVDGGSEAKTAADEHLSGVVILAEHVTNVIRRSLQVKDGRALSSRNVDLLRGVLDTLVTVLRSAGIDVDLTGRQDDDDGPGSGSGRAEPMYLPDSTAPAAQVKQAAPALALLDPALQAQALRIRAAVATRRDGADDA